MKSTRKEELTGEAPAKDRWAQAAGKVEERTKSGQDKLDSALEYERTKQARFDELFKKATEKNTRKQDDE